jgi:hypothetical protein
MKIWCGSVLVGLALTLAVTGASEAASVSYSYKGSLWLSSLNGKQKRKLATDPRGKVKWIETAQSDNGRVIAVKRDPAKIANLNSYVLWGPTGKRIVQGSLTADSGWTSYVMPLSLDLTSNGKFVVYGYQYFSYNYPVSSLESGTSVKSVTASYLQPINLAGEEWPTTVGTRIVASQQDVLAGVQKAGEAPFGNDFSGWYSVDGTGYDLHRTDVGANRKVAVAELVPSASDSNVPSVLLASRITGLGGSTLAGACLLPSRGDAENVSISQDGKSIAWQDQRGVVVAGAPTFGGSDVCKLTRGVKVIAKGGAYPSIGPARLAVKKRRARR